MSEGVVQVPTLQLRQSWGCCLQQRHRGVPQEQLLQVALPPPVLKVAVPCGLKGPRDSLARTPHPRHITA